MWINLYLKMHKKIYHKIPQKFFPLVFKKFFSVNCKATDIFKQTTEVK